MAFYYILKSLNLPRDSEIIFPALTFWVVPEMARVLEFRPKFVDIDPETFNIDPVKMEAAITPNTRVVVPTHLYGQPCEMEPITAAARTHGVFVIEDCARPRSDVQRKQGRDVRPCQLLQFSDVETMLKQ